MEGVPVLHILKLGMVQKPNKTISLFKPVYNRIIVNIKETFDISRIGRKGS